MLQMDQKIRLFTIGKYQISSPTINMMEKAEMEMEDWRNKMDIPLERRNKMDIPLEKRNNMDIPLEGME